MKTIKNRKGFTLVEIVVVLVILAIMAAAGIPALTGYIEQSRERIALADGRSFYVAAAAALAEHPAADATPIVDATDNDITPLIAEYLNLDDTEDNTLVPVAATGSGENTVATVVAEWNYYLVPTADGDEIAQLQVGIRLSADRLYRVVINTDDSATAELIEAD